MDDDTQRVITEVAWELELDREIVSEEAWKPIGDKGFDDPRYFAAFINALRWNCVTATDRPGASPHHQPATVMYLLDALQRFEPLTDAQVQQIATEVSIIGLKGISYTDPDVRYQLTSLPGREFSGLHLLAYMYAGWKRVNPALDTGLDFAEAYASARQLHQSR